MPIPFSITDRMKEAASLKNDSALARDLGVTPQALSNYKRRGDFPAHLVIDFAAKHGMSIDSLLSGKAPVIHLQCPQVINIEISLEEAEYLDKLLTILRHPAFGQIYRASLNAITDEQDKERNGFLKTENDHDHIGKEARHVG